MANKKLEGDPFFPDDALNLPDFDFGLPEQKDDRSPVTKALKGVKEGAISTFKDSSYIKRLLRQALPPVYGEVENVYNESTEGIKKLYNSASREIKPALNDLTRSVDRLVPAEQKKIKSIIDKINKATKGKKVAEYSDSDRDRQREDNLVIELGNIFTKEAEKSDAIEANKRAEDKVESRIRDSVSLTRHKDTVGILTSISQATQASTRYQEKITAAYQKKSLELQMRGYWLAADAYKAQRADAAKMGAQLEAITKNTALPEFVKLRKNEAWKEQLRNKFISDMNAGLFGKRVNFVRNFFERLSTAATDKAMNLANAFSAGAMGAEMVSSGKDMGENPYTATGKVIGAKTAENLGMKLGNKVREKLDKSPRAAKLFRDANYGVRNLPQLANDFANGGNYEESIIKRIGRAIIGAGIGSLSPDVRVQTDSALNLDPDNAGSLARPVSFTSHTNKSITEIIPGYLARIFREIQVLRTGNNAIGLTTYDLTKNRFLDSAKAAKNALKSIVTEASVSAHNERVTSLMKTLGADKKLTKEEQEKLGEFFTKQNLKGVLLSPEKLMNSNFYKKAGIDRNVASGLFRDYFKSSDGNLQDNYASSKRRDEINSSLSNLGRDFNDSRALVQQMINLGMYSELRELGLLNENNNTINLDKITELYGSAKKFKPSVNGVGGRHMLTTVATSAGKRQSSNNTFNTTNIVGTPPADRSAQLNEAIKTIVGSIDSVVGHIKDQNENQQRLFNKTTSDDAYSLIIKNSSRTNEILESIHGLLNDRLKIVINRLPKLSTGIGDKLSAAGDSLKNKAESVYDKIKAAPGEGLETIKGSAKNIYNKTLGKLVKPVKPVFNFGKNVTKFWWKSTAKPLGEAAVKTAGIAGRVAADTIIQIRDIWIDGEDQPRLTAVKLRAGKYFNAKTGEVLKKIHEIKDGVMDEDGNLVLSKEEVAKAYTRNVKGGIIPVTASLLRGAFDGVMGFNSFMNKHITMPALRAAITIGKATFGFGKDLFDQPTDIYVKGDNEPTLLSVIMKAGGYFSKLTSKPITRPSMIDGPVLNKDGDVVLTEDMLKKGIVDKFGRSVGSPFMNLARFAGAGIRAAFMIGKKTFNAVNDVMGGLFGKGGELIGDFFGKLSNALGGGKSYDVLIQIRDLLDRRLPKSSKILGDHDGDGIKEGSTLDILKKRMKAKEDRQEDDPEALKGGVVNSGRENTIDRVVRLAGEAKDKISSFFGDGDSGVDIDIDGKKSRRDKAKDRLKRMKRNKAKGKLGKALETAKAKGVAIGKKIGETKGYKAASDAAKAAASKASNSSLGSKVLGGLGSAAEAGRSIGGSGLLGKGLKVAGAAGAAYGLYSAYDNATKGNYGSAALDLGLAGLGTATMFGGTGALAGIGSAALAAGGSILAGAGAVLTSPVTLGVLAVGAAGYAGYKLYKHFGSPKMDPLTRLRMAQYGFGSEDKDYIAKVQAFEKEMLQYVSYSDGKAQLSVDDEKASKLITYFDFEAKDRPQLENWLTWVQKRFKPIFLTHLTALKSIGQDSGILLAMDKLDAALQKKYLTLVKFVDGPYDETTSPFADLKLLPAGVALVKFVTSEVEKSIDKLIEDDKVNKNTKLDAGAAAGITTAAAQSKLGLSSQDEINAKAIDKANESRFTKFVKGATESALKIAPVAAAYTATTFAAKTVGRWMGFAVEADEAVRFKTYGLIEMDRLKVIGLRNLEEVVDKDVKFAADGKATWDGSIGKIIDTVKGDFEITGKNTPEGKAFVEWFSNRFMSAYLAYRTFLKQATGKISQSDGEKGLKPEDRLDIATKVASTDVWSKIVSPWMDYRLSTDSSSVKENLQLLKDQSKSSTLNEKKSSNEKPKTGLAAAINKNAEANKPDNSTGINNSNSNPIKTQSAAAVGATTNSSSASVGEDGDSAKANAKVTGGGSATLAGGGTGGMGLSKAAPGPLKDGTGADAALLFYKGARLDGMHPDMLRLFKGMVQEYNELTGKKVQVNDGYRTFAEQEALHKANPDKAAPPGKSQHEFGLAVDINSATADEMEKLGLMRKYGFTRPIGGERWHLEMAGTQLDRAGAKNDPSKASELITASPGKGGGGWGTKPGAGMYSRNDWLAKQLYHKGSDSTSVTDQEKAGEAVSTVGGTDLANLSESNKLLNKLKDNSPTGKTGSSKIESAYSGGAGGNTNATSALKPNGGDVITNNSNAKPGQAKAYENTPASSGKGYQAVKGTISEAAKLVGVDEKTMVTKAALESGFNPNAKAGTSSATGLYQFTNGTWNEMLRKHGKRYGIPQGTPPTDARANAILAAQYMKDNEAVLSNARGGGKVNMTDQYMAHFFGPGGASKMIKADDNALAANILPAAAEANKNIFYDKSGRARTVAEVRALLDGKINTALKRHGVDESEFGTTDSTAVAAIDQKDQGPAAKLETANNTTGNKPSIVKASFSTAARSPEQPSVSPMPLPANRYTPEAQAAKEREKQRMQLSQAIRPVTQSTRTVTQANTGFDMNRPQPQMSIEAKMSSATNDILNKQLSVQTGIKDVLGEILGKMDFSDIKQAISSMASAASANAGAPSKPKADETGNTPVQPGTSIRPKADRVAPPIDFSRMT